MTKLYKFLLAGMLLFSTTLFAQTYTISGVVTSAATEEELIGANVVVKGTTMGAATDVEGKYSIAVPAGDYTVVCSYIGFEKVEKSVSVEGDVTVDFSLKDYQFTLNVEVIADRAKERETPVAYSDIDKRDMTLELGSQDIPMVLNTTPSVYATMSGGGAGDARMNIRGFDQNNIAIMINGIPINDMENGWVYWSNWDGVGDATSSIQIQRGLSATTLATPSIGGVVNILTDPASQKPGVKFKQEFGSGAFLKSTLQANTGLLSNKMAFSVGIVKKIGDGVIDKTWTDAWAYYFGASYNIDDNNRLELSAVGAPQRHGQNLYQQNIAAYSHDFASKLDGYDEAAFAQFPEAGRKWNENWNTVSTSYKGQQYWDGSADERYDASFINERENYYHKPIASLNWYSQLSSKLSLYTTAYWSGGTGGGSGTYGSLKYTYAGLPSRIVDWDATIAQNRASTTGSLGILRNSTNNQWTIGAISKAYLKVSEQIKLSVGVDWRKAEIDHYREVRDLLGGDYIVFKGNQFAAAGDTLVRLGDKIDYNFTNTVDWLGFYGQAEITSGKLSAYGLFGWSTIKYSYTNHFLKDPDNPTQELSADPDGIPGYQVKGGASYRITPQVDIFANAGYVEKVPIFDQVVNDRDATIAADPKNEKYLAIEGGVRFRGLSNRLYVAANYYYTQWKDRANSIGVVLPDFSEGLIFLDGMNSLHTGFELEASYQPVNLLKLDLAASLGNWKFTDDVSGVLKDYSSGGAQDKYFNYYVKDLKVGDAPQTQLAFSASIFPVSGLQAQVVVKHYMDYYAAWNPFDRTDPTDKTQSWKAPDYTLIDFHLLYDLPFNLKGVNFQLFAHIFNLLDTEYISDATDNSSYNAYTANGKTHSADDAEVYFGLPRIFNVGISIAY